MYHLISKTLWSALQPSTFVLLVLLAVDRLLSLVDVSYGRVSHGALLAAVTSVVLLAIWVPSQTRWGDKAGLGPS